MTRRIPIELGMLLIVLGLFVAAATRNRAVPSAPDREGRTGLPDSDDDSTDLRFPRSPTPSSMGTAVSSSSHFLPGDQTANCIFAAEVDQDWQPLAVAEFRKSYLDSESWIMDKLQIEVDLDFDKAPFREILASLSCKTGIDFYFDQEMLPNAGATLNTPATINLSGIRARSVLNLLREELGLDFEIRDRMVVVVPRRSEPLITRRYAIGDLAFQITEGKTEFIPEQLVKKITYKLRPYYGHFSGQPPLPGLIEVDEGNHVVVISQTPLSMHALIATMLGHFRHIKRLHGHEGNIDFPRLERLVAWHAGFFPKERLREDAILIKAAITFRIGERTYDNVQDVMMYLEQLPVNAFRSGVVLSDPYDWGLGNNEPIVESLEAFCRERDIDLFVRRFDEHVGIGLFRAVKSSASPYVDEP
ncbi:MAG: DUF4974 domain-containing protein [Planctomycetales bacterium]